MTYYTADRETGTFIEDFDSYDEAMAAVKSYEETDKKDGTYEENFYDIVDDNHSSMTFFSNRIRAERKAAGLTQKALAEFLGFSLRAVEEWEAGRKTPSAFVQEAIFMKLKDLAK